MLRGNTTLEMILRDKTALEMSLRSSNTAQMIRGNFIATAQTQHSGKIRGNKHFFLNSYFHSANIGTIPRFIKGKKMNILDKTCIPLYKRALNNYFFFRNDLLLRLLSESIRL